VYLLGIIALWTVYGHNIYTLVPIIILLRFSKAPPVTVRLDSGGGGGGGRPSWRSITIIIVLYGQTLPVVPIFTYVILSVAQTLVYDRRLRIFIFILRTSAPPLEGVYTSYNSIGTYIYTRIVCTGIPFYLFSCRSIRTWRIASAFNCATGVIFV